MVVVVVVAAVVVVVVEVPIRGGWSLQTFLVEDDKKCESCHQMLQ